MRLLWVRVVKPSKVKYQTFIEQQVATRSDDSEGFGEGTAEGFGLRGGGFEPPTFGL